MYVSTKSVITEATSKTHIFWCFSLFWCLHVMTAQGKIFLGMWHSPHTDSFGEAPCCVVLCWVVLDQFTVLSFLLVCVLDIQEANFSLYQRLMWDSPNSEVSFKIYLEVVSKT